MQLFKAEVPGPTADRLSPRIQDTAKILWGVYFGLTAIEAILLLLGGMTPFEAICHAFTTLSTGGFSTRDSSVGGFNSAYIDGVITLFMLIAGANFSLHFWLLRRGEWRRYLRNEEFRFYAIIVAVATMTLWIAIEVNTDATFETGFRWAAFQTASILTSTGYGTSDYLLWGFGAQTMIFFMMFAGACAGSTAGGIKLMRVLLLAKHANRVMKKALHPQGVFNIRHSGSLVDDDVMMNVLGFILLYFAILVLATMAVAAMGVDFTTAVSATVSMLSNIGPGLGQVGPTSTYAELPGLAKIVLTFCMLFGRLELFTVLVVFMPMFWRKA
jgi:trk system potassium uptake protein TrkH